MSDWKDITSYSRNDEDCTPHWWELRAGGLRISVGNKHTYYRVQCPWLMNCAPWFDTQPLAAKTEQGAKGEAIAMVRDKLHEANAALNRAVLLGDRP